MTTEIKNDSVFIGGVEYQPVKNNVPQTTDGLTYVIIRTYSAGVHIGYLKERVSTLAGIEVQLVNSRRIYSWAGAFTLSELSQIGSTKPKDCKITIKVPSIDLVAIEIIPISKESYTIFESIAPFKI